MRSKLGMKYTCIIEIFSSSIYNSLSLVSDVSCVFFVPFVCAVGGCLSQPGNTTSSTPGEAEVP